MKKLALLYIVVTVLIGLFAGWGAIEAALSLNDYCIYNDQKVCEPDYKGLAGLALIIFTLVEVAMLFLGLVLGLIIMCFSRLCSAIR
ncbi:hypothetical protein MHO82_14395 [Vibrio sp. Of7-15]|uniref:hypothetical protein n=1 Tax=Vibrio sp. Of7-15 TaxID=2724879 RepID=UPI001EF21B59|nr:hypothetical protein [Vibrio sp. Of7-15]MCG7498057.1 hypothetical protein [Vibrio sp. Of7-15]